MFDLGRGEHEVSVSASPPWIQLDDGSAIAGRRTGATGWTSTGSKLAPGWRSGDDHRDRGRPAAGHHRTSRHWNPADVTRASLRGFAEGQGVVSIEPEHFTRNVAAGAYRWATVADYGRTLSGMRAEAPVDAASATPGKDSPCLEYRMYLLTAGPVEVTAITAPTLNFVPDRGVRYAVSIDDEAAADRHAGAAGLPGAEPQCGVGEIRGRQRALRQIPAHHRRGGLPHAEDLDGRSRGGDAEARGRPRAACKPSYLGPPESFHVAP